MARCGWLLICDSSSPFIGTICRRLVELQAYPAYSTRARPLLTMNACCSPAAYATRTRQTCTLASCKSGQSVVARTLVISKVPNLAYIRGTHGPLRPKSIYILTSRMCRLRGVVVLTNDPILSIWLTFAPGKLFASYYTCFIHSPASDVCSAPSTFGGGLFAALLVVTAIRKRRIAPLSQNPCAPVGGPSSRTQDRSRGVEALKTGVAPSSSREDHVGHTRNNFWPASRLRSCFS